MLKLGKLPVEFLRQLISRTGTPDPRVVVGPRFGEDAAVIDVGDYYLVTKTDPVTFTTHDIGWYAVHINANDVAVMGARPLWFQASLLFPEKTTEKTVREVFAQIEATCRELGIAVTGGHTEVTGAVTQPVVVGDMHGLVEKNRLVTSSGAQSGNVVIMTKAAGIEGTSILAREKEEQLRTLLSPEALTGAQNLHKVPGISVVKEALLAAEYGATAMHDPTEGGVAMGLYELAEASQKKLVIDVDKIPILEVTAIMCRYFGLNPLGLIASGTLLSTVPQGQWSSLHTGFHQQKIPIAAIGRVKNGHGIDAYSGGRKVPFHWSEADELTKIL